MVIARKVPPETGYSSDNKSEGKANEVEVEEGEVEEEGWTVLH